MKKRMLSLLLTLCMVLSMTVTASFAAEVEDLPEPVRTCDGVHGEDAQDFATLSSYGSSSAPLSGNYYMSKDFNRGSLTYVTGDFTLCLCGHTLTKSGTAGGGGLITAYQQDANITVRNGKLSTAAGADKTIYRAIQNTTAANLVTITAENLTITNFGGKNGSAIQNASKGDGASVTITNCLFQNNGHAEGIGGAIYAVTPLTVTDSTFHNNFAKDGGAIYCASAGTSSIDRSILCHNNASATGNAIRQTDGELTITDCEINYNTGKAGTIYIGSGAAKLTMNNTDVQNNSGTSNTAGVFVNGGTTLEAQAVINGGTINNNTVNGSVAADFRAAYGTTDVTGKTAVIINDGFLSGKFSVSSSAKYRITAKGGRYEVDPNTSPKVIVGSTLISGQDGQNTEFPWVIGTAYTATAAEGIENGTVTFAPAKSVAGATVAVTATPAEGYELTALTVNGEDITEAKEFKLSATGDNVVSATFESLGNVTTAEALLATAENGIVTLSDDVCLKDTLTVSETLVLDLNGYTLTGSAFPYINVPDGAELTIQDSGENGAISGVEGVAAANALIHVAGKLTLDDGKIIDHALNAGSKRGVAVRLQRVTDQTTTPEFIMNGGEISGHSTGTAASRGTIGMYSGTKFTMNDGKICNNEAQYGGVIATASSTIAKTVTINGGVITGNTGTLGGSVMFVDNTDVLITGGSIYGNTTDATSDSYKTTLFMNFPVTDAGRLGSFTMTGGTIGDEAEGSAAEQVITVQRKDADISGTAVIGGKGLLMVVGGDEPEGHTVTANIHDLEEGASILVKKGTASTSVTPDASAKATVVSDGLTQYTFQSAPAECQHPELTAVEAEPATCTEAGNIAYWTCTCGKYFKDAEAQTEITLADTVIDPAHTYGELVPAQEEVHKADELKAAVAAHYFCSACETYFTEDKEATTLEALTGEVPTHSYTVINGYVAADGHANKCECGAMDTLVGHIPNVDAATEETAKVCTVCEYVIEPKLDHVHNLTHVPAEAADCTEAGNIEYWTCTCGKYFADAEAKTEITLADTVIAAGHTYGELVKATEAVHTATELKAAVAAHYFCDVCDTYFTENKEATTLEALTGEVPTHSYTVINGYVAADGHANKCECGAMDTLVGHIPNVDAATEETAKVCTVCEYVIEPKLDHVHNLTYVPAEAADCTEDGNIEYWTCTCGKYFKDAEAKTEIALADTVLPAGHDIVTHEGKPAAPGIAGYEAYETCTRCDYSTYTEIPALEIAADQQVTVDSFKEAGKAPVSQSGFFGGYYADADKTEVFEGTSGSAYVKFVSKNVLSVKYQFTAGTTAASESTDLRLVTTVDDLNYREIGFTIFFGDRQAKVSTRTVFSSIVANDGGIAFTETPKLFDAQSNYFMTYTITGVPASEFGTNVKVVPYWITLDGTVQEGLELNFRISDKI